MTDKELIQRLWELVKLANSDPDYFYLSKEEFDKLKEELRKRGIK